MHEISLIISALGKAIDRAAVHGWPCDDLTEAYEAALRLKSLLEP